MVKLYKKIGETIHYCEGWEHDGEVTVHWGELGTQGESKTVPASLSQAGEKVIEDELAAARTDGFHEIDDDEHFQLVLQYRVADHGNQHDLEKRYAIEDVLNGSLGWTGNGHCDGGQMGSGSMEIFSYVVDPVIACATVVKDLQENGILDGALVAYTSDGENYKVLYPEDHEGDFSFLNN
jgi:hypothetical protein